MGSLEGAPRDESTLEALDPVADEGSGFLRLGEGVAAFPEHLDLQVTSKGWLLPSSFFQQARSCWNLSACACVCMHGKKTEKWSASK